MEGLLALCDSTDERAINLEDVEWERVKVIERAVPGAEVVHEQGDTKAAKAAENRERGLHVGSKAGFGHLQAKLAAGESGLQKQRLNMVGEAFTRELAGG